MVNIKYLIYINGQSIKPLVNSIREAKRHAERHLEYQPSLKIECYRAPITTCIWIYDYQLREWVKAANNPDADLCCLAAEITP
jgi:hypothetical protein